jgi:hypothetical protein
LTEFKQVIKYRAIFSEIIWQKQNIRISKPTTQWEEIRGTLVKLDSLFFIRGHPWGYTMDPPFYMMQHFLKRIPSELLRTAHVESYKIPLKQKNK